jgi:hypothetical protein
VRPHRRAPSWRVHAAVLLLVVGCAGTSSEPSKKEQGNSPEATESEQARCEGTQDIKKPNTGQGVFTTNDIPGCVKGDLLSGTDKPDKLAGENGADEIRGLGAGDFIFGGPGNDIIYGGDGADGLYARDQGKDVLYGGDGNDELEARGGRGQDKLYCGEGRDEYIADNFDHVASSCEVNELKGPRM